MDRALCRMLILFAISLAIASLPTFEIEALGQELLPAPAADDFEPVAKNAIGQEIPFPADPPVVAAQPPADFPAYLGVTLEPQLRNVAVAQSISPGSPAQQAGLQAGDTIEAINGRRIASYQDVLDTVKSMRPGDRLEIDYSRRIHARTQAVLDSRPAERRQTARYAPNLEPPRRAPEQLPPPTNDADRQRRNAQQYPQRTFRQSDSAAVRQNSNGNQNARRTDDVRQRRPADRPRGLFDRNDRDRGLLRWRRN